GNIERNCSSTSSGLSSHTSPYFFLVFTSSIRYAFSSAVISFKLLIFWINSLLFMNVFNFLKMYLLRYNHFWYYLFLSCLMIGSSTDESGSRFSGIVFLWHHSR